jgi:hypothetical protein
MRCGARSYAKLKVKDAQHARKGVPHLKVSGKGGKTRYLPHGTDENGALFRPIRNNRTGQLDDAITPDGIYKVIRIYSAQLGFEIGAHALRATAATTAHRRASAAARGGRRGARPAGPEAGSSPAADRRLGLARCGHGTGFEDQRLVDLSGVTLCGELKQLARHDHQGARIALGVIADRRDDFFGHQGGGAGLLQSMPQAGIAKLTDAKTCAGNRRAIASHHAARWTQVSCRQVRKAFARTRR